MNTRRDLKRLIFNITSLVDLGQEVTSSKGLAEKMKTALYVITGMFSVPRAALLVYAPERRCLDLLSGKGFEGTENMGLSVTSQQIKTFPINGLWDMREVEHTAFYKRNKRAFETLRGKILIPLFAKDEFVGTIILGKRLGRTSFLRSERDVLTVIAHQMAITLHHANLFRELMNKAAENERLFENMRHIYYDTIQAFAAAIDAKDRYTKNHSSRVARYAEAIARELGWSEKEVEGIYIAGLLHDIGKIIIDSDVINKGEKLTPQERDEIKRHPGISYEILTKVKLPWKDAVHFIKHHHERLDGSGYPDSLVGAELSDGVRILGLADAFDAMTSDRPYRERLSLDEAFHEIQRGIGTQFDSRISRVFLSLLQKEVNGEGGENQILPHLQEKEAFHFDPSGLTCGA